MNPNGYIAQIGIYAQFEQDDCARASAHTTREIVRDNQRVIVGDIARNQRSNFPTSTWLGT